MYKCKSQLINEFKEACSNLRSKVNSMPKEKISVVKDILGLYSKKWENSLAEIQKDERNFMFNNNIQNRKNVPSIESNIR